MAEACTMLGAALLPALASLVHALVLESLRRAPHFSLQARVCVSEALVRVCRWGGGILWGGGSAMGAVVSLPPASPPAKRRSAGPAGAAANVDPPAAALASRCVQAMASMLSSLARMGGGAERAPATRALLLAFDVCAAALPHPQRPEDALALAAAMHACAYSPIGFKPQLRTAATHAAESHGASAALWGRHRVAVLAPQGQVAAPPGGWPLLAPHPFHGQLPMAWAQPPPPPPRPPAEAAMTQAPPPAPPPLPPSAAPVPPSTPKLVVAAGQTSDRPDGGAQQAPNLQLVPALNVRRGPAPGPLLPASSSFPAAPLPPRPPRPLPPKAAAHAAPPAQPLEVAGTQAEASRSVAYTLHLLSIRDTLHQLKRSAGAPLRLAGIARNQNVLKPHNPPANI